MLVVAQAFTSSGFHSNRDTCLITFVQPAISVSGDSAGRVGDTIHFSASIDSGGLQRWEYIWEIDSTRFFSADSLYARAWGRADTGRHVIVVMALSNEGRKTDIDTLVVHIRGQAPKVRLPADMMRSSLDSVRLTATVSDSDGVVDSYRWRIHDRVFAEGGNQITLRYNGADSVIVTVEVVDDDGYVDWDTCVVRFNTPPTTPALRSPVDDTMRVHLFDSSLFNHVVSFSWSADDADGPNDTLQYAAFLHVGADSVFSLYEGADTAASISGLDTGNYRWSVEVRDRFGHVRSDTAAFSVVLEKRICFIGHSIAVGVGGDSATGGFRAAVLHMLRSELNEHESLIPVGPVATGYLEPVRDDACAAIVGEVAPHIWQLLEYARPEINADMWVVYLGVNGSYNGTERDYIYKIINTIYGRNAAAQAVLIGGFPYHYYPVVSFNGWLYYTAEYMREDGRRIRYVDVDDPFTRSGYVNLSLVPDGIHPNQQGYDILSRMIADTLTMMQP
jgi:lysophospholipase L1-like esterase